MSAPKIVKLERIIKEVANLFGVSPFFAEVAMDRLRREPSKSLILYDRIEAIIKE